MIRIPSSFHRRQHSAGWQTALALLALASTLLCLFAAINLALRHNPKPETPPEPSHELAASLSQARADFEALRAEWAARKTTIRAFREAAALPNVLDPTPEGRIDFKVALFEARRRLGTKAEAQHVTLPSDLGISDTIGADEDTETRLGQLAATVLLLEKCITHGVPTIVEVRALPPSRIALDDEDFTGRITYPVYMRMRTEYSLLIDILDALIDDAPFFTLRHFHAVSLAPDQPDWVEVRAEWNILVFSAGPSERRARGLRDPLQTGPTSSLPTGRDS